MPPRQKPDPEYYENKFNAIRGEAAPTLERVDSGDFTVRDIAILMEHLQSFSEVLEEIENNPPRCDFRSSDAIAETVLEMTDG